MKTIELVVPCYNEEKCIKLFYEKIKDVFSELKTHDFIITFVDDGSKDNTMEEIKNIVKSANAGRIQYISLSRNFGKEAAMYAGLSKSTGDYVAVLDADLQHPPALLAEMIHAIENEGYDCASARRISRKGEPLIRSFFSRSFYHLISKVTAIDLMPGSTDYRLMTRKVVEAIVSMSEHERFTKGIYSWVGFKNKWIEYENVERVAGTTSWSFRGLVKYAYGGFIAFATTPLRGVVYMGMLVVVVTVLAAIWTLFSAVNSPTSTRTGYATIILLIMFFSGVTITILGMIGEYLARIYMEVKNRPLYFTRETNIGYEVEEKEVNRDVESRKYVETK